MASRSIPGRFALLTLLPLLAAGGAPAQAPPGGPDDPEALARRILDDAAPREARERLAKENADRAVALVRAMTADLPDDAKEEYRRIPWVWRVSIAAGRAGKDDVLRGLLDVSLPREGERLRDWQAVVLG
ncbi:MAG TPA: hypothetical protein VIL46_01020, partial [Gemmataceae bacterium]